MTTKRLISSLLSLFAVAFASSLHAQSTVSLDRQVQQLFEQRCAECHGRDLPANKRKGNKQMFFDAQSTLTELDRTKALVRGNPADSSLIQKVIEPSEDDRMPPKGARLTTEQVSLLRQWIAGNSPGTADGPPPATAIKRADLFRAALADLQAAPVGSRRWLRYLTLHNLRNAGDSAASLRADRAAVSKTLNSLSSESRIAVPVALGPDGVLLRFDLRDYGWDDTHWNLLAAAYPYEIEPPVQTKTERDTRQATGTVLPILRADWFVFAATQSPFYERLLSASGYTGGLPDSDAKLEQQLGLHVLQNIRGGRVQRAAFTDSGVSDANRMIERHALPRSGYYWKSYDFANERGTGDLSRNPLGPPEANYRRAFQHDGGETIWSLPNGLQGYLLYTAKGGVITRGPTGIVTDPDGPQGAVINGVSCMRCHSAGMRPPKGGATNVTTTHARARDALDDSDREIFDRLYREGTALGQQLEEDGRRFKEASRLAGVTEDTWFTPAEEPVSRLYGRFKADITARTLAAELDLDPADVQARLREYDGAGDAQMNSLLLRLPKGIKRQNFIADFALLGRVFSLGNARRFSPVVFEEFRETTGPGEVVPEPAVPGRGAGHEFVNSLGMKFVPVPGTDVSFSIWHTRVQDYQAFATATGRAVEKPRFAQGPTHPAVTVSWDDAQAFVKWLTQKERGEGRLTAGQSYRLPQDWEWSVAVGLNEPRAGSPKDKDEKIKGVYPWGGPFPPPRGAGNYERSLNVDDYEYTSPVGSFTPNAFGLHDMGGNAWQWCEDLFSPDDTRRVLRGGSWDLVAFYLLSSSRIYYLPDFRNFDLGFRVVLVGGGSR